MVNIREIVDHHCLGVIVGLFTLDGSVDYHCLEVIVSSLTLEELLNLTV